MGLTSFITSIIMYFICTYVVDALAPTFGSEKNAGRSAQLVAYSYTAAWVAGIFYIIPSLSNLAILLGLYSLYAFYLGFPQLKKTPEDKRIGYLIASVLVVIVVVYLANLLVSTIFNSFVSNPLMPRAGLEDMRWR